MGEWIFRKTGDPYCRGICVLCNKSQQKRRSNGTYRPLCSYCDKRRHETENSRVNRNKKIKEKRYPYIKYKKESCEFCGFLPVHKCQLDVDHIDGNHHNNDVTNLQTLCANCHRLKTYLNRDWEK